ncbi:MAG: helix-hairpin-helix domain-containing protein [Candidatus Kapabacteria bacterium]|nr:helix-hairpin-helix domain-containing protein [Candidatus Kapabacteria bacterium]MCS7170551.1 helix-hairpin-helix domain-containing protein [Candidatus Kapabacteria bacterium]MDW7996679.1 helix-hairpin-helix domain-containing protein [Bacteroidota bacterium]MDW8225209.1 helix-hairpin-helix domain-containing protein [Bacteroidota bacterium]
MLLWDKLQRSLGINRREAWAVTAILGFLALGALHRWFIQPQPIITSAQLRHLLDSITWVQYDTLANTPASIPQKDSSPDTTRVQRQSRSLPPTASVNINIATKAELMSLPGIGAVIAERIVEYRQQKPFETPEELLEVKGIGPKKFERIRPYVRVK